MQNSMVGIVHLICFKLEILFLGKFGSKNQNCQFKAEICCVDYFEYVKFDNDVLDLFCKVCPKIWHILFIRRDFKPMAFLVK